MGITIKKNNNSSITIDNQKYYQNINLTTGLEYDIVYAGKKKPSTFFFTDKNNIGKDAMVFDRFTKIYRTPGDESSSYNWQTDLTLDNNWVQTDTNNKIILIHNTTNTVYNIEEILLNLVQTLAPSWETPWHRVDCKYNSEFIYLTFHAVLISGGDEGTTYTTYNQYITFTVRLIPKF